MAEPQVGFFLNLPRPNLKFLYIRKKKSVFQLYSTSKNNFQLAIFNSVNLQLPSYPQVFEHDLDSGKRVTYPPFMFNKITKKDGG